MDRYVFLDRSWGLEDKPFLVCRVIAYISVIFNYQNKDGYYLNLQIRLFRELPVQNTDDDGRMSHNVVFVISDLFGFHTTFRVDFLDVPVLDVAPLFFGVAALPFKSPTLSIASVSSLFSISDKNIRFQVEVTFRLFFVVRYFQFCLLFPDAFLFYLLLSVSCLW